MKEGKLVGFLGDAHIYFNQMDGVVEQLKREPMPLCSVEITNFKSIYEWQYTDIEVKGYNNHGKISFPIAV